MPLTNALPQIDDRQFESLLAEVRTRIPRYTPEWTDLNDNEPGITMLQVFAWLAEMLTYRMNKVPELSYIKFLQLVGIELQPAEPALAEITFPVLTTHPQPFVIVPPRTQVAAEAPEGGPPIVFETDRALVALTAKLASVISVDGPVSSDVTKDNDEAAQGFEPFGAAVDDNALMLGFDFAGEFPAVELDLAVTAATDGAAPRVLQCGLPDAASFPSAHIKWECWDGALWRSLTLLNDGTFGFTRSGHVTLRTPAKTLVKSGIPAGSPPRFWIRARLENSQYERPPRLLAIRTSTVAARQAETIGDEVLGGSDGSPNQVFRLSAAPVLAGSLRLEVDEGEGFEPWRSVDDLFGSGPGSHDYVLNRTTGEVRFGDGINGAIPVANAANPDANVVAREYRFGGGKLGNVPAGAIQTVVTSIEGLDDANVCEPARGEQRSRRRDARRSEEARPSHDQEPVPGCNRRGFRNARHASGDDQTREGAPPLASRLPRREGTRRRHGHRRARQRRCVSGAERGHAPNGLRVPRHAPATHDRALRRRADVPTRRDPCRDRRRGHRRPRGGAAERRTALCSSTSTRCAEETTTAGGPSALRSCSRESISAYSRSPAFTASRD